MNVLGSFAHFEAYCLPLLLIYHAQVTMPVYVHPCIKSEDLQHIPTDVLQRLRSQGSEQAC